MLPFVGQSGASREGDAAINKELTYGFISSPANAKDNERAASGGKQVKAAPRECSSARDL